MWNTANYWFDTSIVFGIFAVGNILFGHFEEHRPKSRRLLKVAIVLGLAILFSWLQLRWVFGLILLLLLGAAAYVHLVWLPKHGINGWTGEPKDRYLKLVGAKIRKENDGYASQ